MPLQRAAWAALGALTLAELISLYRLLFAAWMTAHPLEDPAVWRSQFRERLVISILVGLLWSTVAFWLFRHRGNPAGEV